MKVINNQQAPDFQVLDVYENPISISQFKGKKILLTFFRNAGCPVCNLRFHALQKESNYFKSKNLVFIGIYESQKENMLKYVNMMFPNKADVYPIMVANPQRDLYELYNIERSVGKLLSSIVFHGGISNVNAGKKLYNEKIEDDSPLTLIPSDFLIDETGKVVMAHYGKYSGQFIPITDIKKFVSK
jgi:thioredoxin-dependent peroxiredoxin